LSRRKFLDDSLKSADGGMELPHNMNNLHECSDRIWSSLPSQKIERAARPYVSRSRIGNFA
jgi:hypothetical protein